MPEGQASLVRRILVANRGEIAIRVFRSSHELGLRTVAIYSHEDRFALHRFKADEAYRVGKAGEPIRAYLDIAGIVAIAKQHEVDAIHPGYGFLSENPAFARACREAGLIFIGPRTEILEQLGDKLAARRIATQAGVPILAGSDEPVKSNAEARAIARKLGFPVIVKASMGGGGRGMRIALRPEQLDEAIEQARREAGAAFGVADVFLEKYLQRARHIEVQLVGDQYGQLVHLFERDCSLQRRHQKIVEIAPALNLDAQARQRILDAALAVGKAVHLDNASTVEFLLDADSGRFYFIEVNPRLQVEHTVTEVVTGVDIVKSQILIAQGRPLSDPEIGLDAQEKISTRGFAFQCRVTTEDPGNNFLPHYGRLSHYRSASGMGIRLDAGSAFSGAVITPFYDSLLVKVTAHGLRFFDATRRMERCLQEFRVRGVKTNIPFLLNLVTHADFLAGRFTTSFLDETPALFALSTRQDRATKLLTYIGEVIVNGHPDLVSGRVVSGAQPVHRQPAPVPPLTTHHSPLTSRPSPSGTRDKFHELGAEGFSRWILDQQRLLVTDTTFRDAHQSLLATRMRTFDMLQIAPVYAAQQADLFSLEIWGGATFDTSMRFLKESPWDRLADLRERIPNILFQMLFRAANAVGYTNYPDNVVKAFVKEAAQAGIDLFRIFDALNWLPNLRLGIEAVRNTGMLCEPAICYTGDILDLNRSKYDLKYYVELARELEKLGANVLAIKDMAGLCKPYAAQLLVRTLKQEVGIPIHFHTHDSAGSQIASLLLAAEEDVDIVDAAMAPFSGMTSQPSLNALVEALRFTGRDTGIAFEPAQAIADYWDVVRRFYRPFDVAAIGPFAPASNADVYRHEMPGGQYTNLYQQAQALGLESRWGEVCRMYAEVNSLFGDIIKVTPTSKVVGDMALFMVGNSLTPKDVLEGDRELAFPESVVEFFEGRLGQPPGGFPKSLQKRVLRGRKPMRGRPGASLPPADFAATRKQLEKQLKRPVTERETVSYLLYPRVFPEFEAHQQKYSDTSLLPTPVFFHGMEPGEEISVDIEAGKTLIIKFITIGDPQPEGNRLVFFELNGQPREVLVIDRSLAGKLQRHPKAEPDNPLHVGAPMPGLVVSATVAPGEKVAAGQKLFTLEAMKMETTLYAERAGTVAEVLVKPGTQIESGDLLLRFEAE
ncbi:MAG TPA: pyruvate carboxylase [Gemmataceae bacterium]|jgi:pyruvate carboxylase|nr:pyruvate carboxylase [Gemmataceae bacterium]